MPHQFVPLAERIVDALLDTDPVLAHYAGDHRSDHVLPDWSPDAVRSQVAMLRDASNTLAELDLEDLVGEEQIDHELLARLVDRRLFELQDVVSHEWNPLVHNPGPLLHGLLARPPAPSMRHARGAAASPGPAASAEQLESVVARLWLLPDVLNTATRVLADCPTVHLQTAVTQYAGVAALIRDEVPRVAEQVGLTDKAAPAQQQALAAFAGFDRWLRGRLDAADPAGAGDSNWDHRGDGGGNPRLGRRLWEARLWHGLDSELTAEDVLTRAWSNLDRVAVQIREAASELMGGAPDDATVRAALDQIATDRPDDSSIVPAARDALAETTAFVAAHDLVSLPDEECQVVVMPEFARGVAVAYCDSPGPLESANLPTWYAISPTPDGWSAERRGSFYREYNQQMVRDLTVHEAMPGHFLQLAHSHRHTGATRVRALCKSGSFVEGWAVYAEELMAERGYGGLPVRLQQLKMQLRMTINAILDQLAHCEQMTEAEAMRLMRERGFQEEGEAAGKWRRALLTSAQLSTYFVGYSEVSAIAAQRPAGQSPRQWHDAMLSHGSPAPRHLGALLRG